LSKRNYALDQISKTTAMVIRAAASQPSHISQFGSAIRRLCRLLATTTIIANMIGTATMPLITAAPKQHGDRVNVCGEQCRAAKRGCGDDGVKPDRAVCRKL
jgi:hypothetical protein